MGILEQVSQMKREGASERDIIAKFQSEGVSPREITEALSQSQIKQAISKNDGSEDMQPSIMDQGAPAPEQIPQPTQETYTPQMPTQNQQMQSNYPPQQQEYYPEESSQEEYYADEGYDENMGSGSDLTIEIAEQVFSEKIKKVQAQIKKLEDFKTIYGTKIDDMNERLKRMEKLFDKMQISILDKIGSYGKNIEGIKNELSMVEDSVSKMIKPVLDKVNHKRK